MNTDTKSYLLDSIRWLNKRYGFTNDQGVYFAHQPIYGFHDANSEPNVLERFNRTYLILQALARLKPRTLLDVGSSEGFQASLARHLMGIDVVGCDLSEEACRRAQQIYGIATHVADVCNLPFQSGQFDVCTCSETLEHVIERDRAVEELLRVAARAVVITVPCEKPEIVAQNIERNAIQSHIQVFDETSFDYLRRKGLSVLITKLASPYLYYPNRLLERWRHVAAFRMASRLIISLSLVLDPVLVRVTPYSCIRVVLLKDTESKLPPKRRIHVSSILSWQVPHHHIKQTSASENEGS